MSDKVSEPRRHHTEWHMVIKDKFNDEHYISISYGTEENKFSLYVHDTVKDDCFSVDLTSSKARHIASVLTMMASFVDLQGE